MMKCVPGAPENNLVVMTRMPQLQICATGRVVQHNAYVQNISNIYVDLYPIANPVAGKK